MAGSELNFLTAERVWLYQYVLMTALLFCVFWYFYKRNEWYWWSVVSSTIILLIIYFQVQVSEFVNEWSGSFFNVIQLALTQPGSVTPEQLYGLTWTIVLVTIPSVLVAVGLAFYTSHYVFRWRKAMNFYYMAHWPKIRTTEGAAQRVQEDTMRFAAIMEDLGTAFFDSLITLVVFLPLALEPVGQYQRTADLRRNARRPCLGRAGWRRCRHGIAGRGGHQAAGPQFQQSVGRSGLPQGTCVWRGPPGPGPATNCP